MLHEELREIRACLPQGRTLFHYERGWHQVMLLGYLLEAGWTAPQIRRSAFARLLEAPTIKPLIAARGQLALSKHDLQNVFQKSPNAWRLTLGEWGSARDYRWQQITRKGCNLVLQINFPELHNREYRRLFSGKNTDFFNYCGHPVSSSNLTLAWVRLDVDMERGQVLIEEIQSDWVRGVDRALKYKGYMRGLHRRITNDAAIGSAQSARCPEATAECLKYYAHQVLPGFANCWQETAMSAALFFVVEELGIHEVFMHEFETGNRLKNIGSTWLPPRSIYTTLPRKFCFRMGNNVPELAHEPVKAKQKGKKKSRKIATPRFWHLLLCPPGL